MWSSLSPTSLQLWIWCSQTFSTGSRTDAWTGQKQHRSSSSGGMKNKVHGVDEWVVSCNRMSTLVAPSGECLCGKGLVWFIAAVVFASCCRGVQLFISTCNGWPHLCCGTIGSCRSTATSYDCKAQRVRFRPRKTCYIRISGFSF